MTPTERLFVGTCVRINLPIETQAQTEALARCMGAHLQAGDCLLLEGPVGAGKSVFARALIQAQMEADGRIEDVPSPTFTLMQTYETSRAVFCHADLYRLADISELEELGLNEMIEEAICLIEWPERLLDLTPERHLSIVISLPDDAPEDHRAVQLLPQGAHWDWITTIPAQLR